MKAAKITYTRNSGGALISQIFKRLITKSKRSAFEELRDEWFDAKAVSQRTIRNIIFKWNEQKSSAFKTWKKQVEYEKYVSKITSL